MKTAVLDNYSQPITYYGTAYTLTEADRHCERARPTLRYKTRRSDNYR